MTEEHSGLAPENTGRIQDGRFQVGVSGNPAGRPKGARNRSTRLAEALLDDDAVGLVRQAIDLAKAGNMAAIRLCVERLIPRRVERAIEFEMQPIAEPKDAIVAISRIMEGVGSGELTASEAGSLVSVVQAALKAIEVLNLDDRLAALEVHHARS
jgi:Family of unknown function (DUF5681)